RSRAPRAPAGPVAPPCGAPPRSPRRDRPARRLRSPPGSRRRAARHPPLEPPRSSRGGKLHRPKSDAVSRSSDSLLHMFQQRRMVPAPGGPGCRIFAWYMDVTGSLAVVTGATEGIGRATALALGRSGARVAICARTEANVHATVRELKAAGIDALGMACDVSDPACVDAFAAFVTRERGAPRMLVNNAGIGRFVAICPGSVDTGFRESRANRARVLTADDVALAILSTVTMPDRAMISEVDIRPTNP